MNNIQSSFVVILVILFLGITAHYLNMGRVHRRIEELRGGSVTADQLYFNLFIPQGSNFNALALTAWMLVFVSIAYLYFFTPGIFPSYNYFIKADWLASSWASFAILALGSAGLATIVILVSNKLPESVRYFRLTELYGYYNISKNTKRIMVLAIPLLWASIWISAYLTTIYPERWDQGLMIAFALLLLSLFILFSPILQGIMEVSR